MERKITEEFEKWKNTDHEKALLVKGCRQIGKTYSILEFAHNAYKNVIYVNFEDEPSFRSLFSDDINADSVYEKLSFTKYGNMMTPGETVIVLDEIQSCKRAFSALKPLSSDGRFDIIASGSLLGIDISGEYLSPTGYVHIIDMYPMDFEEFLWANGIDRSRTDVIRKHIREERPFDSFVLDQLHSLFLRFLVIGGLPKAVSTYTETKDYSKVSKVLEDILTMHSSDAMKYSLENDRMRILTCLRSIPRQIGKENNTFSYYDVEQIRGSGYNRYGSSLEWLTGAGLAYKVSNVTEPREPLCRNAKDRSFKMYMSDTGMLVHMMGDTVAGAVVNGDFKINNGAIMENAVAVMLITKGYTPYFFQKSNSTLELDFVLPYRNKMTAVEVKSGRYDYPRSLITAMSDRYGVECGVIVSWDNTHTDGYGVKHFPLFAVAFFEEPVTPDIPPVDGIPELNRALR